MAVTTGTRLPAIEARSPVLQNDLQFTQSAKAMTQRRLLVSARLFSQAN